MPNSYNPEQDEYSAFLEQMLSGQTDPQSASLAQVGAGLNIRTSAGTQRPNAGVGGRVSTESNTPQVPNLTEEQAGRWAAGGSRPWIADAQALGSLGLGLASFLEGRRTGNLQRQMMRQDLSTAREHQANRRALGESWNRAWGQS